MDHPGKPIGQISMTRDDRNLVFIGVMVGLPLVAWLSVAAWRYGVERPIARGLLRIAKLTPHDDFLIGALVLATLVGFVLAHGRRIGSEMA